MSNIAPLNIAKPQKQQEQTQAQQQQPPPQLQTQPNLPQYGVQVPPLQEHQQYHHVPQQQQLGPQGPYMIPPQPGHTPPPPALGGWYLPQQGQSPNPQPYQQQYQHSHTSPESYQNQPQYPPPSPVSYQPPPIGHPQQGPYLGQAPAGLNQYAQQPAPGHYDPQVLPAGPYVPQQGYGIPQQQQFQQEVITGQPYDQGGSVLLKLEYSPGYNSETDPTYKPKDHADSLRNSLAGELDLDEITKILPKLTPPQIQALKGELDPDKVMMNTKYRKIGHNGVYISLGIKAFLRGPLQFDVHLLCDAIAAIKSSGVTKVGKSAVGLLQRSDERDEFWKMQMVLLDRKNGDIDAIKCAYSQIQGSDLLGDLTSVLAKYKAKEPSLVSLFQGIVDDQYVGMLRMLGNSDLSNEHERPQVEAGIKHDISNLEDALTEELNGNAFVNVYLKSSRARFKEVIDRMKKKKPELEEEIKRKFKPEKLFCEQLQYILKSFSSEDRARRDAELIWATMKGIGTNEEQLVCRLIKASWEGGNASRDHLKAIKAAWIDLPKPSKGSLEEAIKSDISEGPLRKFVLAIANSDL
ncbi:hypothetical protein EDC01DRAFT_451666 [Geopyxis carbonaria]|nr:hypothetical protein EDC01DRAFT_451666 [Geopyxis carbonaria]